MARHIQNRWSIKASLRALTPLHIGGIGSDADTDLALAVNGRGHYYIPGTSLAGALRGWMGRHFSPQELEKLSNPVNQLWGFQDRDGNGHASFLIVDDAEIKLSGNTTIEIREGVGIDRHSGAAAKHFKYSRAILPKGVTFPLNITLDCQENDKSSELWQLLQALEQGDIRIGAAKTRGLGRVKLEQVEIHQQDLNSADGIFATLLDNGTKKNWDELKQHAAYNPLAQLTLDITWKPRDPVMVKAEGDGIAVDMLPLVSQVDASIRFVIPGSSIKGVLRAHAERIVRTLLSIDITPNQKGNPKFNEQIQLFHDENRIELVDVIFGSAEKSKTKKSEGKIGALSIDDCYAKISIQPDHWAAVEAVTAITKPLTEDATVTTEPMKDALRTALDQDDPFQILQPAMHVAVDRWTGGAAEGMLYSILEPIGVSWEDIGLHLDLERLQRYYPTLVKPAIALLLLVLRDFANRRIPIGYGTNRGMGTVDVIAMTLNSSSIQGLEGLAGEKTLKSDLSGLSSKLLNDLTNAWQSWIRLCELTKAWQGWIRKKIDRIEGGSMTTTKTTLYSYRAEGLELKEAIDACQKLLEGAIALLYSPQNCQLARFDNGALKNSTNDIVRNWSDFFEARIFNESYEVRWLNSLGGKGVVVLLTESQQAIETMKEIKYFPEPDFQTCESLEQKYLLWGEKAKHQPDHDGWQRLAEARIGRLDIPLLESLSNEQRVYLRTHEYLGILDGDEYGNMAVIEERLVKLEVA